jgi:Flp pilus assembly protein TadD
LLLHGLGTVLFWRVLVRLQMPGAGLAAALFALHPVSVESVAWVTERKNVLCGVFYFAAALTYLRFTEKSEAPGPGPAAQTRPSTFAFLTSGGYWLSLFLFACALLSKTVACTLPAALLLVGWWKRGRIAWREVWPVLPFFAIGAGLGLLTAHIEKTHVGAQGADWDLSIIQRCLIAGRALWFYAGKLAWPADLAFIYPRWEVNAGIWWQWLFPVAALGVVLALWRLRKRIGCGPLVAVLFFAGTLFPALGFINVYPMRYSFVADHFQYLAQVGLLALVASLLYRLPGLFRSLCTGVLLAILCGLTWSQAHAYRDVETLWRTTINNNPACWLARYNLGVLLDKNGQVDEAIRQYRETLRIKPDAGACNNLGNDLAKQGQAGEAVRLFQEALRLDPDNARAHCGLGNIFGEQGRVDEAIREFQEAIRLNPDLADARNNLGIAFARQARPDDAIRQFQEALRLNPDDAEAHFNLSNILGEQGRLDEAIQQFQEAIRLKPDFTAAQQNLARAMQMTNAPAGR